MEKIRVVCYNTCRKSTELVLHGHFERSTTPQEKLLLLCLTRKTDYALVAMADLRHQGDRLSSARQIAERCGLPAPALTNILKQLTHFGLVSAARGPHGGYQLARPPEGITLVDLIEAVEGPTRLTFCCDDEVGRSEGRSCGIEQSCRIKEPVRRVHEALVYLLRRVTLEQIACDEVPVELGIGVGI